MERSWHSFSAWDWCNENARRHSLVEMTLASFVWWLRVIIQLKDLNKAVKLIQDLLTDSFHHGSWHLSGSARICPIDDANTLDCVLKLAINGYDALDQAQQVANLEEITTTRVDRAGAAIVASMQANNLKMALLCLWMRRHFLHGDERKDER